MHLAPERHVYGLAPEVFEPIRRFRRAKSIADSVMDTVLKIFIVTVLALAFIGWLADRRAAAQRPDSLFCQATSSTKVQTEIFASIFL